jgi:hypothetical protein
MPTHLATVAGLVLTLLSLAAAGPSLAAAGPRLVAQTIPGLFTGDGTGAYEEIYQALQQQAGGTLPKLEVIEPGLAIALYQKGTVECQTPANANPDFYPVKFATQQSKPMNVAKIYIFSKPGTEPYDSLDALKGKKIALREGFSYGSEVNDAGLETEYSLSIEANIKKLLDDRVDALVDFVPDAWEAFANYKMAPLPHRADKPVAVHEDAFVCRDTPETRAFLETINRGLDALKASSALQKILGPSYIPQ